MHLKDLLSNEKGENQQRSRHNVYLLLTVQQTFLTCYFFVNLGSY